MRFSPSTVLLLAGALQVYSQCPSVDQSSIDLSWHAPNRTNVNNLATVVNGTGVSGFIFNNSINPAGVPYNTYNWCNMPHVRSQDYVKGPSGYKLEYVELIHRHHKRTPYAANTFPQETYSWYCNDEALFYYGVPYPDGASAQINWNVYTSPSNPFAPEGFNGTCQFPQISSQGLNDSRQHGKDLWGVYHDLLGFLPTSYNGLKVVYRVTNNVITSQVAGQIIDAMYPTLGRNNPFSVLIQPDSIDSLEPTYTCDNADSIYSSYGVGSTNTVWTAHLNDSIALFAKLDGVSGVNASDPDWHQWFDHYFDNLSARLCHEKPLPCNTENSSYCITQEDADAVFRRGEYEYSFIYRDANQSLTASTASFGVWLAELASNMRQVMNGESKVIYRHNVAHDGSVSRLLSILQVDVMVWPGMGSEVVFELYSKKSCYYLRVLWGGQVLRSSNPSLGLLNMVPVQVFLGYVDGLTESDEETPNGLDVKIIRGNLGKSAGLGRSLQFECKKERAQREGTARYRYNAFKFSIVKARHARQDHANKDSVLFSDFGPMILSDSTDNSTTLPRCQTSDPASRRLKGLDIAEDGNNIEKHGLEKVESGPAWSSFGRLEKKFIILIASLGAFFSPLTTNIYFPALTQISTDLGVTISQVNLSITTYMIFQGLAPSFIGTFADNSGRRPAYVIGFAIYIASNIDLVLNNSYVGLMILRCVQSCGSSGMVTLKTAIIADVVTSAERGSYIAFTSLGSVLGPAISPVAGGLLTQYLGWHSIFWFLVIISSLFFIPLIACFPETGRVVVGDGSISPPAWNKSLLNLYHQCQRRKAGFAPPAVSETDLNHAHRRRYPHPWSTARLMCEKETALILMFSSIIYAGFYVVSTTITTQFTEIYHLSASQTGLIFLPIAGGTICAALTNGKLLDANYRRHAKRLEIPVEVKHQRSLIGFPVERARLEIALPMFIAGSLAVTVYGWLLHYKVHIAGPIVMLFVTGYACLAGFSTFSVLIIDIHRKQPATASAASNLMRCLLGAGASAVVNPMIEAMGNGWCYTLVGLVWLAFMPTLWFLMNYGPEWRVQRETKEREKTKNEQETREYNVEGKKAGKLHA